ncbi:hypothetical protein EON82_14735 [bacterium]|nr:MAG: hypothetical protein EON82_14735 [bacterium]
MKRALVLFVLVAPTLLRACINDRDTLGFELRNRPDAQMALTGRFERNPPLYYQMRVARLRAKGQLSPAENDDLAVALERLGKSEEALRVLTMAGRRTGDEKYRFFANRGTFRAHRWLRRGTKRSEMHELKVAENDIARALKINPNAHFGREAVQLEVMRWLGRRRDPGEYGGLGGWLDGRVKAVDPIRGLAGLIMLGNAWESPDVAIAIAELGNGSEETFSIGEMAHARYQELLSKGKKPLDPAAAKQSLEHLLLDQTPPAGEPPVKESFRKLRDEAEDWHRARTQYMVARLEKGRHPDADPSFWSDWKERAMPKLSPERGTPASTVRNRWLMIAIVAAFAVLVGICTAVLYGVLRLIQRLRPPSA